MIRVVPTGDLGLDLLLGGGWQLVERLPERHSATVVVRGGPGVGKTLMALQVALKLAKALGGDVAVGCVEILPSEYLAQVRSARSDIDATRVIVLPEAAMDSAEPRVFCGLLTDLDPAAPDLVASLESLGRDVTAAGGRPAVFVVDSLIEGYGIGESAPRTSADAVMKFAAQGGCGLVLCEETRGETASTWVFAADTVLELGVASRERGRWIEARKHRFSASVSGRHELEIRGDGSPAVYPHPHAWAAPPANRVLTTLGWRFSEVRRVSPLTWHEALQPVASESKQAAVVLGDLILVTSPLAGLARTLAIGLTPAVRPGGSRHDLSFDFDPLIVESDESIDRSLHTRHLPTMHGAAHALRALIEGFGDEFLPSVKTAGPRVRRVLLGDLQPVLASPDALDWVDAVRVFASLVAGSGWGIPVIAFHGQGASSALSAASLVLAGYADVQIVGLPTSGRGHSSTSATVIDRLRRKQLVLNWPHRLDEIPLPPDLADFDRLPPLTPGGSSPLAP